MINLNNPGVLSGMGNSNISVGTKGTEGQNDVGKVLNPQSVTKNAMSAEQNMLNNLVAGDIFEGVIKEVKNDQVYLNLSNGQVLLARLENGGEYGVGQRVSFMVESNTSSLVTLKAIDLSEFENPTILKALDNSGIGATPKNLMMVKYMMEENMSVNKENLNQMYKTMLNHKEADVKSLVLMKKYDIPVTDANLKQFQNYRNYENQILNDIKSVAGDIPNDFSKTWLLDVYDMVLENMANSKTSEIKAGAEGVQTLPLGENLGENVELQSGAILGNASTKTLGESIANVLSSKDRLELALDLKNAGVGQELIEQIEAGTIKDYEVLSLLKNGNIKSEPAKKLLSNALMKQWSLTPEEIAIENKIEELYQRINKDFEHIQKLSESMGKGSEKVLEQATNVRDNINFMNQINQMYTYVQIPLKMMKENVHSDLYVFTNKKNLLEKEGELTALLHLDMEHLGQVDVFLKLLNEKLETEFRLEDESSLKLIEAHIDMLSDRLVKKGYDCNITFKELDKTVDFVEDFLKGEEAVGAPLQKYSFDVRM